jgi:DNA mismatch endonuclease (patch repair protein)
MVFAGRRKVIFVHGCFWHGHDCARGARLPKENAAYWSAKIGRNRDRDGQHLVALRADGWKAHVVWECQMREPGLLARLKRFLGR